jgi:hypothetical protein
MLAPGVWALLLCAQFMSVCCVAAAVGQYVPVRPLFLHAGLPSAAAKKVNQQGIFLA